jgi:hypothetical protein
LPQSTRILPKNPGFLFKGKSKVRALGLGAWGMPDLTEVRAGAIVLMAANENRFKTSRRPQMWMFSAGQEADESVGLSFWGTFVNGG